MINNRQAGRRRGRGGNNNGPRQGGGQQGNGSRIDSRARGNATQLHEKYKNMAADAQRAGDRVTTEYYLQHADHYFRVLSEQRGRLEEQQPRRARDDFDFDGSDEGAEDYGDEGEPIRGNEQDAARAQMREGAEVRQREDRPQREERSQRDDRPQREDRARDERPRGDREFRRDGNRDGGRDGNREGNRDSGRDGTGDSRPRNGEWQDRPRERRPEQPVEIAAQRRAEPLGASESLEGRAEEVLEADRPLDPPAPRRRGRPPRAAEPSNDAGSFESAGFEADRLPPALTVAANDEAPAEPKPRRRRVRPAEDTPTAAE